MGLLGTLRIDKHLDKCLSAPDVNDPGFSSSIRKLRAEPAATIPKLIEKIPSAEDSVDRRIHQILDQMVDTATLPAFFSGLHSEAHPKVVATTVDVLSKNTGYDPTALLTLFDNSETAKTALLKILRAHKNRVNPVALIRKTGTLQPGERLALFRLLEDCQDEAIVPELVSRVSAKDPNTRLGVVKLLAHFNTPQSRNALLGRLTDKSKTIRFEALEALEKINTKVDIGVLCTLIKDDDYNIQTRAVDAVIKRNDPKTVKYLIDLLKDESEYVRRGAVEVLNGMQYPNAIEDLLGALKDTDWWVRARAADALAQIGGPRVVNAVVKLIRSKDEYVRRAAIEILNSTKSEAALDELIKALDDSDWWVRERAIDALANIGNAKAVPGLINLMKRDTQAAPVVLRGLSTLADSKSVPEVQQMLESEDPNIIIEAMYTLSALVDSVRADDIKTAIKKRAKLSVEEVQEAAAESLERIEKRMSVDISDIFEESVNELSQVIQEPGRAKQSKRKTGQPTPKPKPEPGETLTINNEGEVNIKGLSPGDELSDRYTFVRRIGKGAFSTVLLVEDTVIDEQMILKVLHQKMALEESMIKRFIRELRFARKIQHKNVIRIYDFLQVGSLYAISMEYFPSLSLSADMEAHKPMDFQRAINITADVAAGLEVAHEMGVIHRDIKPGNILVDNKDQVKIVDFGISAAQTGSDTKLTKTGILIGTPRYMAPEQVLGKDLGPRTDIYSLGIIFYEMLSGITAFAGDDNMAVLYQHVHGKIDPVHKVNDKVPLPLSNIVMKMMAVKPEDRFQSMKELEETLRDYEV